MKAPKLFYPTVPLLLVIGSCIAEQRPIPIGTYVSPSREESISVGESRLHFHVRIDSKHPNRFVDRSHDYGVHKNQITLHSDMAATSAQAAFGFERYDWKWDGEAIIRHDPRSGEILRFTREQRPQ
jgi:hypothetical protein